MLLALLLLQAVSQTGYRGQFPLPNMAVPSGLGVNIHIIAPQDDSIERISKAGFKWIRMDMLWDTVEHTQGEYDFSQYDKLESQLEKYKIRPIYILDYGNDYYEAKSAPRSEEAKAAFVKYVHATIQHYRHRGVVWEMYNEPNIHFWKPYPNVKEYVALATMVAEEIRQNEPDEWFVGPGMSGMDFKFAQGCIDGGLLQYWDAVTVHPYRTTTPETTAEDYRKLQGMISQGAPAGKKIPVICSEWGYSDMSFGEVTQSQYLAREYLSNLMAGVPLTIWYDWKNDGDRDSSDGEAHFGVVGNELQAKQALLVVRGLVNELSGFSFIKRLPSGPQDYVLEFKKGNAVRFAVWTEAEGSSITLGLPVGDYKAVTLGGDTHVVHSGTQGLDLEISGTPTVVAPVVTGK